MRGLMPAGGLLRIDPNIWDWVRIAVSGVAVAWVIAKCMEK